MVFKLNCVDSYIDKRWCRRSCLPVPGHPCYQLAKMALQTTSSSQLLGVSLVIGWFVFLPAVQIGLLSFASMLLSALGYLVRRPQLILIWLLSGLNPWILLAVIAVIVLERVLQRIGRAVMARVGAVHLAQCPDRLAQQRLTSKSRSLLALAELGARVPATCVLTHELVEELIAERPGRNARWLLSQAARGVVGDHGRVLLRSAFSAEDQDRSAAGVFYSAASSLDPHDLLVAARQVAASARSQAARSYLAATDGSEPPLILNILVQPLLAGPRAVCFTADPVSGDGQRLVVEWREPNAESLRRGSIDKVTLLADGELPVGMSEAQRTELVNVAVGMELAHGAAQDLEWVWHKGEPWWVQCRPARLQQRTTGFVRADSLRLVDGRLLPLDRELLALHPVWRMLESLFNGRGEWSRFDDGGWLHLETGAAVLAAWLQRPVGRSRRRVWRALRTRAPDSAGRGEQPELPPLLRQGRQRLERWLRVLSVLDGLRGRLADTAHDISGVSLAALPAGLVAARLDRWRVTAEQGVVPGLASWSLGARRRPVRLAALRERAPQELPFNPDNALGSVLVGDLHGLYEIASWLRNLVWRKLLGAIDELALGLTAAARTAGSLEGQIYFCFPGELQALLGSQGDEPLLRALGERQQNMERDFSQIEDPGSADGRSRATDEAAGVLQALPVSRGVVTGTLLRGRPGSIGALSGAVVAIDQPDPMWITALGEVGGIILIGMGQLSHLAILARELGKPAVALEAPQARALESLERVTVDGMSGEVRGA